MAVLVYSKKVMRVQKPYVVYILRTSGNTLYVGSTNDLSKRLLTHKNRKGAKYLRMFDSFKLVFTQVCTSKTAALRREREIKSWSKAEKEQLVKAQKER